MSISKERAEGYLNSSSKPGTWNKTTQKPGARTSHERDKTPNTPKRKTGPGQKEHQRQVPGEQDRRPVGQSGKQDSSFTFYLLEGFGSLVRRPSFDCSVLESAPFEGTPSPPLVCSERRHGSSAFALRTPTRQFVSGAVNADTAVHFARLWGRRPLGERVRRETSEHLCLHGSSRPT